MANALGVYNPIFYAQEALTILYKALGMAGRVNRVYEGERSVFQKGDTISIRRPSTFTVTNAPASAADLNTETVSITLNQWKEVKFKLTDKELAYTQERIIADHISPMAYALADNIDQALVALGDNIPWFVETSGGPGSVADFVAVRKLLFTNGVPLYDVGNVHFQLSPTAEANALALAAFAQQQGAGDQGVNTQMRGSLGMKYGMETYANQNTYNHVKSTMADFSLTVTGVQAAGSTTLVMGGGTGVETMVVGDQISIAGFTQKYAVTSGSAVSTGAITVGITPALQQATAGGEVVTVQSGTYEGNLAFHKDAFALVMVPLPMQMANAMGAKVATVADPVTGLSIRSRMYYVGNSSEVHIALDILYGVKCLNPNLAVKLRGAVT